MKAISTAAGDVFSYFCIGFTVPMLNGWVLGNPTEIELALVIGVALAGGRLIRLLIHPPAANERGPERRHG